MLSASRRLAVLLSLLSRKHQRGPSQELGSDSLFRVCCPYRRLPYPASVLRRFFCYPWRPPTHQCTRRQNIVLSGGSTMFKAFGRRLQRDIKRRADARMEANRRITMQVHVSRTTHTLPELTALPAQRWGHPC